MPTAHENPEPAGAGLFGDGALTTRAAAEFSSLSRTELFELMESGALRWFRHGKSRRIPKRALIEVLAKLYATAENRDELD